MPAMVFLIYLCILQPRCSTPCLAHTYSMPQPPASCILSSPPLPTVPRRECLIDWFCDFYLLPTPDVTDLTELRALEEAGVRRRRRWLNDRILRDMAGPMSMEQMEAQFKPVPFGGCG